MVALAFHFMCDSVLNLAITWQLNCYFILIFPLLSKKCIYKLAGYFRITFDNHLHLGIQNFQFFLREFQVAFR